MVNIRTYKTLVIEGMPEQISLVSSFLIDKSFGSEEGNHFIKLYFDNKNMEQIDAEILTLKERFSFENKWEIHEYKDWHLNWKENFKPVFFGNEIIVKPDWDKEIYDVKKDGRVSELRPHLDLTYKLNDNMKIRYRNEFRIKELDDNVFRHRLRYSYSLKVFDNYNPFIQNEIFFTENKFIRNRINIGLSIKFKKTPFSFKPSYILESNR